MNQILKNNIFKKSLCLIVLLLGLLTTPNHLIMTTVVKADSGFDSSWNSGSSSGSSSSSHDSGNGEFSWEFFLVVGHTILVFFIYVLICTILLKKDGEARFPVWFTLPYIVLYLLSIYYIFGEASFWICYLIFALIFYIWLGFKIFNVDGVYEYPIWYTILYWIIYLASIYIMFDIGRIFYCTLMFLIVGFIYFICGMIDNKRKHKGFDRNIKKLSEKEIYKKLGSDFNIAEFNTKIFNIYRDIQIAWMERNVEPVRHLLSDEMFNMYRTQLATLIAKNQKNMMEDIEFVDCGIINISNKEGKEEIKVSIQVTCRDYLVDSNNKLIRGNREAINDYTYQLTFVRSGTSSKLNYCPNCGARLNDAVSNKCEYCDSVIIKDSDNFVMTDKKMLFQRVKEYKKYEK